VPFIGYNLGELASANFICSRVGLHFRPLKNLQIETLANAMLSSEKADDLLNVLQSLPHENTHVGYGLGITYKSPLGPLNVCMAFNNHTSRPAWYINLGFTF
jgi:hypothetical protein